jgi:uncharacterized protein (TIGR02246 family)
MTTANKRATAESQIRALVENWAEAVRAKDINGVMSRYAPDLVSFDIVPPLQNVGADVVRKNLEEWFLSFQGPIGYEVRELSISAADDLAFCHSLNRISGSRKNGEQTDVWVRVTVCFRKDNGKWMVAHEHISVPFDMASGRASIDLKP